MTVVAREAKPEPTMLLNSRPAFLAAIEVSSPAMRAAVMDVMLASVHESEVFQSVVGPVTVDVVDVVSIGDGSVGGFPDQAVFKTVASIDPPPDVAIRPTWLRTRMVFSLGMPETNAA